MADCRFILANPAGGGSIGELGSAVTRKLEYALDGPATATFTLPGDHPDAKLVAELACDLLVLRDNVPIFRGRVGSSGDTITADTHTCQFSAVDYRGMLDRRILWAESPLSFRQVDQGQIAWQLIADTQSRPGGGLGITQGTGTNTGVPRDRDYTPGQKLGDVITQLGEVINGFDWEIDANLRFNVFYPQRGRPTGVDLVFGSQIAGATRTLTSSSFANAVRYSGSDQVQAVEVADTTIGPTGRFEAQVANVDLQLQQSVVDAAAAELDSSDQIVAGYHLDLFDGWWDPNQLWLGDEAALFIRTGRLNVDGDTMRVVGLSVEYDDAGGEAVSVDMGANPPSMTGRLSDYQSRIEAVERVQGGQGYLPDAPVGAMYSWPGASPPQTWAWADGTAYPTTTYPELFAIVGYTYGGSGGTFNVPDCRSRVLVAAGAGPGLTSRTAGTTGGTETVALSTTQNGYHYHNLGLTAQGLPSSNENVVHNHSIGGNTATLSGGVAAFAGNTGNPNQNHAHVATGLVAVDGGPSAFAPGSGYNASIYNQTGGDAGPHNHAMNHGHDMTHAHGLPATTGNPNTAHQHTVNGTTDPGSSAGAPHENMPPFIAIGQIIRILPPWRPTP